MTRSCAFWLMGVLLIGASVACEPRSVRAPTVVHEVHGHQSLLALLDDAEVDVPPRAKFAEVPPAFLFATQKKRPDLVKMVPLGQPRRRWEARESLWAPVPSRFQWSLKLPSSARFEAAIGQLPEPAIRTYAEEWLLPPRDVGLEIRLRVHGSNQWKKVAEADVGTDGWKSLQVDLSAWHDQTVDLQVSTTGPRGAPALIANPVVVATAATEAVTARKPNVLLIVVDTLRAASVGCYGYRGAPSTPAIDALCGKSAVFDNAVANSNWTRASTLALFTGRSTKQATIPVGNPPMTERDRQNFIDTNPQTMPQRFARAGYAVKGFVNNLFLFGSWSRSLSPSEGGVDTGFPELYGDESGHGDDARRITKQAKEWISNQGEAPFFAYVHYANCHAPYREVADFTAAMDGCPNCDVNRSPEEKRYDGAVAFDDNQIAQLISHLDDLGITKNTLVVVTADHGEVLDEAHSFSSRRRWPTEGNVADGPSRFDHGRALYREVHWVPMMISGPKIIPNHILTPFQHSDLGVTLPALAGLGVLDGPDGLDLSKTLTGEGPLDFDRAIVSEGPALHSLRTRRWSYIMRDREVSEVTMPNQERSERREELYDLQTDPLEHKNLAGAPDVPLLDLREQMGALYYQHLPGYHVAWTGASGARWVSGTLSFDGTVRDCGVVHSVQDAEVDCNPNGIVRFRIKASRSGELVVRTVPENAPLNASFQLDDVPLVGSSVALGFLRIPAPSPKVVVTPASGPLLVAPRSPVVSTSASTLFLWRQPGRSSPTSQMSSSVIEALSRWGYLHVPNPS
jgi:arylsulfatase A-like enzyme